MTVGQVSEALRTRGFTAPQAWIPTKPTEPAHELAMALVSQHTDDLLEALEGPTAKTIQDSGPNWRGALAIQDYDLLPPFDYNPADLGKYITSVAAITPPTGEGFPSFRELYDTYTPVWGKPQKHHPTSTP